MTRYRYYHFGCDFEMKKKEAIAKQKLTKKPKIETEEEIERNRIQLKKVDSLQNDKTEDCKKTKRHSNKIKLVKAEGSV